MTPVGRKFFSGGQARGCRLAPAAARRSRSAALVRRGIRATRLASAALTAGGGSDRVSSGVKVRLRLLLVGWPGGSLRDFFLAVQGQKTTPQDSTLTPAL